MVPGHAGRVRQCHGWLDAGEGGLQANNQSPGFPGGPPHQQRRLCQTPGGREGSRLAQATLFPSSLFSSRDLAGGRELCRVEPSCTPFSGGFSFFYLGRGGESTASDAQGLLLALSSGIIPGGVCRGGAYGMPGIEPTSAMCNASILLVILSLWPAWGGFLQEALEFLLKWGSKV